jgi:uracil-DNA glycosylase
MSTTLRDALDETMRGWKQALPEAWRPVFKDTSLNTSGIPAKWKHHPWIPIFPVFKDHRTGKIFQAGKISRKDNPNLIGIPYFAHTFRALLVPPEKVRVVIVGQDPYPDITDATGQSFEQGSIRDWIRDSHDVAGSLKPILKLAAHDHTGNDLYARPRSGYKDHGWDQLVADLKGGVLQLARPDKLFPAYQKQGVLWINTTLSISLFRVPPGKDVPGYQKAHSEYWKPFVSRLFEYLASRTKKPVVFGLWGSWAKSYKAQIVDAAKDSGTRDTVRFLEAGHPVTPAFLKRPTNALSDINKQLVELGQKPINWFPE